MPQLALKNMCTGCTACYSVCPKHAIDMGADAEGFLHPVIAQERCISCGLCEAVCPVLHSIPDHNGQTVAYAAICTQEDTRMQSTSGGVFTLLARWVIGQGGTVFGAAYDQNFSVHHCGITRVEDLKKLRTAKYSQSVLGDSFCQVRKLLKEGRYVLFSGTPCQIAGLQAYLKKPWERLILVDVICHGVPSPKVWEHYIAYRRNQDAPDSCVQAINLRSKETGWPGYSIRFAYENGTVYSAKNNEDPFLRGFVGDYYLRPSCYECGFKGISRSCDFTLADYWGVWNQLPEYHDGRGTSLVLLHSPKAHEIWTEIQSDLRCREQNPQEAVQENPSALTASRKPGNRAAFWERYEKEDFQTLITELLPPPPPPTRQTLLRRGLKKLKHLMNGS